MAKLIQDRGPAIFEVDDWEFRTGMQLEGIGALGREREPVVYKGRTFKAWAAQNEEGRWIPVCEVLSPRH